MKSKKIFLSIAILLVTAFIFAGCGIVPAQPKGTISGQVLIPPGASEMSKDISGWVPAAGATVTVVDADGVTHTTTTDENGYYSFENIAVNSNTVVTATVTVDGKTIVLKDVISQSVAADEDYNAGTMTPESTALALVVEELIDEGISQENIVLAEIQASETFTDLIQQVTTVIDEQGNVTEDTDVIEGAGNTAEEIINPPAPTPPSPPSPPAPTPEDEYHTYKFNIEGLDSEYVVISELTEPTESDFAGMVPVKLSIVIDEEKDKAYEGNVRVNPVGASDLQLWAKDTSGNWYDINEVGWGPEEGFPINTTAVTDVYVVPTAAFVDQEITIELVDITGDYVATDDIIKTQDVLMTAISDETAPTLTSVTPEEGSIVLGEGGSFVWTVNADDEGGLKELEIDHSFEDTLPEFSVYANPENPYGTANDKTQFEEAGVTVTYDENEQEWSIDFGEEITTAIINKGVTFYIVITDLAGNKFGTMSGTTSENTFAYKLYDTIQAAVDGATDGDVIEIAAGTYTENVLITTDKSLSLSGVSGTILSGGIIAETTTPGKSITVSGIDFETSGLEVDGYDIVAIKDNTFTNIYTWTTAQYADGSADAIYVHGSATGIVTIQRNIITGVSSNTTNVGDGMGITVLDLDYITISGNDISDTWHNSINIFRDIAGSVDITDNTLSNWDSNKDVYGDTNITSGCEGGRALRIELAGGASLVNITGNTFEPNDNPNPVDPNYVKITNCNTNIATLKSEIKNYNTWPDGVDYDTVLTVE